MEPLGGDAGRQRLHEVMRQALLAGLNEQAEARAAGVLRAHHAERSADAYDDHAGVFWYLDFRQDPTQGRLAWLALADAADAAYEPADGLALVRWWDRLDPDHEVPDHVERARWRAALGHALTWFELGYDSTQFLRAIHLLDSAATVLDGVDLEVWCEARADLSRVWTRRHDGELATVYLRSLQIARDTLQRLQAFADRPELRSTDLYRLALARTYLQIGEALSHEIGGMAVVERCVEALDYLSRARDLLRPMLQSGKSGSCGPAAPWRWAGRRTMLSSLPRRMLRKRLCSTTAMPWPCPRGRALSETSVNA